jgi:uncharacterized protein (DUF58 family)
MRRARTRGVGAEFHEYRHYQPGDDPRSIDWTVEARLQQLVVRVSRAEGHLALHTLVDVSASMGAGNAGKLACATRAAAALCYLAVEGRDSAGVASFTDRIHTWVRPAPGRAQLSRIFDVLDTASTNGRSGLDAALERYAAVVRGPGLVAILSDWFDEGLGAAGLQALLHRGLTPAVIQIVAPDELDPELDEDTELHDIEDTASRPLVVDPGAVAAYRDRIERHSEALRDLCLARGLPFARLVAGTSFAGTLASFENAGLVGV